MSLRILLLGKVGQLGWEAQRTFSTLGDVIAIDYPEIDFSKPDAAVAVLRQVNPQIVFNTVAYTAVDQAEKEEQTACLLNATTPGALALEARRLRAVFLHISTDFVFDGKKGTPYTEADMPCPLNAYGKTKLDGESAVSEAGGSFVILRTSWLYSTRRPSFVTKTLEWARKQKTVKVVDDQIGSPTWARVLAEVCSQMIAKSGEDPYTWFESRSGIYHLGGNGWTSRYGWAQEVLKKDPQRAEQIVREIIPAKTYEFPTPAVRPLNTALNCSRFEQVFHLQLPTWQDALQLALE
jgi:dTDP-4-dehydrorhamnose reductase